MEDIKVEKLTLLTIKKAGDFNTQINNNVLYVPELLFNALSYSGSTQHTACNLIDLLDNQSTYLMVCLGWTLHEVNIATAKLKNQLKGYVSEDILKFQPGLNNNFGALPPNK